MKTVILLIMMIFTGCDAQSKLPKEMPVDVVMSYSQNGGMSPYYTDIKIENDTLIFKEKSPERQNKEIIWTAKISNQDKINLYKLFVENKIDLIKNENRKGTVYDAGSDEISISFSPNSVFNVHSGANFPLSSTNETRYGNVSNEFRKLAKKYEATQEKSAETSLEEARKQAFLFFESIYTPNPEKAMYSAKFTPFFPTDWKDANQTKWVSYVYASGMERLLNDGERVAKSFAKITYNPSTNKAVFEKTSSRLEDFEVQGVKTLPKEIIDVLGSYNEIEKILLNTKSKSELSSDNAEKVVAFYEYWKKYNGVIYNTLSGNHGEFNKWIYDTIPENTASDFSKKIAVINFESAKHNWIFKEGKAVTLTKAEIAEIHKIITKTFDEYNSKKTVRMILTGYKFQYLPVINSKNEKIIWVNAFCGEQKDWMTNVIAVDDGGTCYWQMFVNLTDKTGNSFTVNGVG